MTQLALECIEVGVEGSDPAAVCYDNVVAVRRTVLPLDHLAHRGGDHRGADGSREVLPIVHHALCQRASDLFGVELTLPVLDSAELYGSKLVAAMDRQHPRDLFDALQMLEQDGLSDETLECFVTYLAGHNRPIHEVLFGNDKDISLEYRDNFVGMTTEEVSLDQLLAVRQRLRTEIPQRLTAHQKAFLVGLSQATPDWSLLACPHAQELPALRWKLANLETFRGKRPADFHYQATQLMERLGY